MPSLHRFTWVQVAIAVYVILITIKIILIPANIPDSRLGPFVDFSTVPFQKVSSQAPSISEVSPARSKASSSLISAWVYRDINLNPNFARMAGVPVVDESGYYEGADGGWFRAMNLDGSKRWKFRVDKNDDGLFSNVLADSDRVYFGAGNGVFYCLQKATGQLIWSIKLGFQIGRKPLWLGSDLLVPVYNNNVRQNYLVKLDKISGKILWQSSWLGENAIHLSYAADKSSVFVALGNRIYSLDAATGEQRWLHQEENRMTSDPLMVGDGLFFSSRRFALSALSIEDGMAKFHLQPLHEDESARMLGFFSQVDSFLIAIDSESQSTLLAFGHKDFKQRWKASFPKGMARLVANQDISLVKELWLQCADQQLCKVRLQDGRTIAKVDSNQDFAIPAIFNGDFFVMGRDLMRLKSSSAH